FNTACWIPPVGKRDAHSIYYGDLMLEHIVKRFISTEKLEDVPSDEELKVKALERLEKERLKNQAKSKLKGKKASPLAPIKISAKDLLDEKVNWLKSTLEEDRWEEFTSWLVRAVFSYGRHEREHA